MPAPRGPAYQPLVKGWLADFLRTGWAFFYWNARKSLYRWRGRRGQCPCQNPSDSGEAMRTGCEAVAGWARPQRFRRVCPLLQQNEAGSWVCSVAARDVRPFWGRAFAHYGALVVLLWVLAVVGAFGGLRAIGYHATLWQVAWPPAWRQLNAVRADLFIRQARESYAHGKARDAINALVVAYQLDPTNYDVGMTLARFYQAGSPGQSDALYRRLMAEHADRRNETARAWFHSLLARGRLRDVAALSRRQLVDEPAQASAWVHALLFATRLLGDNHLVEAARADPGTPGAARAVLDLALRVRGLPRVAAARLLLAEPLVEGFPYDGIYRVEALMRRGYPQEASGVLVRVRSTLAGRDVARLILALQASARNGPQLEQGFTTLLAPDRQLQAPTVTVLAVHLVTFPDAKLLGRLLDALPRVLDTREDSALEAAIAVFCAAGVQQDQAGMDAVEKLVSDRLALNPVSMKRLEDYFLHPDDNVGLEKLLPGVNPLSLELNYALLERFPPPND